MKENFFYREIEYTQLWKNPNAAEIADTGKPYLIAIGVYVTEMHRLMGVIPAPALMDCVMNFVISSGYPGKKVQIYIRQGWRTPRRPAAPGHREPLKPRRMEATYADCWINPSASARSPGTSGQPEKTGLFFIPCHTLHDWHARVPQNTHMSFGIQPCS